MNDFAVNLIRHETLSTRQRRRLFLLMIAYLAVAGTCLVLAFASAAHRFAKAAQEFSDLKFLERDFQHSYRTPLSIAQYGRQMERETDATRVELEQIREALANQAVASRLVIGIASALPTSAYLRNLQVDATKHTLVFDVAVPLRQASKPEFAASQMIGQWDRNVSLAREVQHIEAVASERQNIDTIPYLVWKFSAKLGGRET